MTDRIILNNIRLETIIGVYPEEKLKAQPVIINAELLTDCSAAAGSDNIEDAVDYSLIHDEIVEHASKNHYELIETLLDKICEICLKNAKVNQCTVRVDKPKALKFADSVGIEITRSRK